MWMLMGAGGVVTWGLLACGAVGLAVFLERLFNLHRAQMGVDDFLKGVYTILKRGNTAEAATMCEEAPGPVARLALAAVLHGDESPEELMRAIEGAGQEEIPRMERGLGCLATLARVTPMLGLLGTVLGMMEMLWAAREAGALVEQEALAGGLWEAMSATALSLVLAVLLYAGYNFLVGRVESLLLDMERSASSLAHFMATRRTAGGAAAGAGAAPGASGEAEG
ncbi:MAG: MotA/TolQ/ExbB proton channel family protein [Kiritimatiellae bacterium]|nr:MotA/TolQ/ExbB proton channel family protein [Kiritimatiellia bacterium]